MNAFAQHLHRRSIAVVDRLDRNHRQLLLFWTMAASFACGIRLAMGSLLSLPPSAQIVSALPYVLIVSAPIASLLLALHWFRRSDRMTQPSIRLARVGRWREVGADCARAHPLYGVTGIMASLLVGMLINIPVRTLEFLAAIPSLGAAPPHWFATLYGLMLADVVLLSSLYAIAFVAALRRVPLFPRLLAAIWALDLLMQFVIANGVANVSDLPPEVAMALQMLLIGNAKKVVISIALWAPYLIMSRRVNVTFRHRVEA